MTNRAGEPIKDSQTREQAVGGRGCRLLLPDVLRSPLLFFRSCKVTVGDESVPSLFSFLVIISLASSARMMIASDWPYLSLPAEATISVGGVERWQFD